MNRKKKINQTLKAKAKKANAKLHSTNKPAYVSKAERERLAQQALLNGDVNQCSTEQ
ncbi:MULTISPECIES: DUF2986 domain-containing protein [Shewanella]|uniref:DUF2986 domain-containing protein n=3 Tax=Shewanella TaxID=22 RepID=A0A9X2CA31_9GAMM|nr:MULTISPECIES: DUF2986 domain-containing protein [Shewanella]MCL1101664.1 DUF2986 domain-containing protein [Shewanella saliphila]MCL1105175.1 DUF2986 domain-containing protein [Shewanella algicola]MCT8988188.1 DUF2986 domain-containing protein [Shewanella sp. KJ10-1]GGP49573.1 hypothetical protein GCM10009347_15810 [Shewanella algicola]